MNGSDGGGGESIGGDNSCHIDGGAPVAVGGGVEGNCCNWENGSGDGLVVMVVAGMGVLVG